MRIKGKHSNLPHANTYIKLPENNNTVFKEQFFTALQTCIDDTYNDTPSTTFTIISDLNINLLQPKQKSLDFFTHNLLYTTTTSPTRYNWNVAPPTRFSLIDTILTKIPAPVTAGTIPFQHLPLFANFYVEIAKERRKEKGKILRRGRYNRHKDKISNEVAKELKHITNQDNVAETKTNDIIVEVNGVIKAVVNRHKRRPKDRHDKPWIHPRIKRMIRQQHRLREDRKNNPTPETIRKHSRYRQIVKKAVKQEKRKYLIAQIKLTKDSPTHRRHSKAANKMNEQFINTGKRVSETLQASQPAPEHDEAKQRPSPLTFALTHTTGGIVKKAIDDMDRHKAADINDVTSEKILRTS
eukprot:g38176.t1